MLDSSYDYLKPYDENDLIRLGKKGDGGYVISKKSLEKDNCLLTFGMSSDWTFEEDFVKHDSENFVHIYDHTVNLNFFFYRLYKSIKRLFYFKSNFSNICDKTNELIKYFKLNESKINHFKNKISNKKEPISKSLEETIKDTCHKGKIMLKIDIEGDEFEVLKDLNLYSNQIHTLIVEFHELNKNYSKFEMLIKEINKNFYIIHIHGNNITGINEIGLPNTLEISFLNYNLFFRENKKTKNKFPIKNLDFPNHNYIKDIEINFTE
tara:strand:- start:817 stop:1611 length:795 start_codon:yes stop_codon:yes gene_type:complete